jgi:hypothetical protein
MVMTAPVGSHSLEVLRKLSSSEGCHDANKLSDDFRQSSADVA